MKIFCVLVLVAALQVGLVVGDLKIGSCDGSWYFIEKTFCDIQFVIAMAESEDALTECPSLYQDAHKCLETKIVAKCLKEVSDEEKRNKAVEYLEEEFGNEYHFCTEGLLISMKGIVNALKEDACRTRNSSDYDCEDAFHEAFKEEFGKTEADLDRLEGEYATARQCQNEFATDCYRSIARNEKTYHFFDLYEFNPYDSKAYDKLKEYADKIEHGESIGSPDNTAITVALVGVAFLLIVAGIFFYLWRRDKARAEIRREKRESRKSQGSSQKNGDTEMQALSSAAVVQTSDEVASA